MLKTYNDIKSWLIEMGEDSISSYTIERTHTGLVVNCDSSVFLHDKNLIKIPIQFGLIKGNFTCSHNKLTSLMGCPHTVTENFSCSANLLCSLLHAPKNVGDNLYCSNNKLTTLKHLPAEIKGDLICYHNNLITLEGMPDKIGKDFSISFNELFSLEHIAKEIGGMLYINDNFIDLPYERQTYEMFKKTNFKKLHLSEWPHFLTPYLEQDLTPNYELDFISYDSVMKSFNQLLLAEKLKVDLNNVVNKAKNNKI